MGQYYKPTILKQDWKNEEKPIEVAFCSWDYGNGAKLMEHSYVGNNFVAQACRFLGGKYKGYPFVWCGDYADCIKTNKYPNIKVCYYDYDRDKKLSNAAIQVKNLIGDDKFEAMKQNEIILGYSENLINLFDKDDHFNYDWELDIYHYTSEHEDLLVRKPIKAKSVFKYIINYDKKEYVKIPKFNPKKYTIHPLPLLCASGNGRGGGDYTNDFHASVEKMVGTWAYDRIGLDNEVPVLYKEIKVDFNDGWR